MAKFSYPSLGLREEDLLKLELLKFGKSVTTSNEEKERCPEDEYLCTIQKQEEKSNFGDVDSYNSYSYNYARYFNFKANPHQTSLEYIVMLGNRGWGWGVEGGGA